MSGAEKLDRIDYRILDTIQTDATLSIAEIAGVAHLSQNACWRRIKRLEGEGFILRRVGILDHSKLQAGLTVFVSIRAVEHSEDWLERFRVAVTAIPEIMDVYRMSGEVDYLLKLRVADMAAYDRIYKRLIGSIRLSDVSSAFAMEEIRTTTTIALPMVGA